MLSIEPRISHEFQQFLPEFIGGLMPLSIVFIQRFQNNIFQPFRYFRIELPRLGRIGEQLGVPKDKLVFSFKRELAGQQVEKSGPDRVDIHQRVVGPYRRSKLLGSHIRRCPAGRSGHGQIGIILGLGNAEIDNFNLPRFIDHDIARLDIPVKYPLIMRELKRIQDLDDYLDRFLDRKSPAILDEFVQRLAVDILHGDNQLFTVIEEMLDLADIPVSVQERHFVRLLAEPIDQSVIR